MLFSILSRRHSRHRTKATDKGGCIEVTSLDADILHWGQGVDKQAALLRKSRGMCLVFENFAGESY